LLRRRSIDLKSKPCADRSGARRARRIKRR
jgi:hypothetical protein